MKYKKVGYKYELAQNEHFNTTIVGIEVDMEYAFLGKSGDLVVFQGYQWDGPSGPTIDDDTNMCASLEHDVFYQMLREGHLMPKYRKVVDKILFKALRKDGMSWLRAKCYYWGVRFGGGPFARPGVKDQIYEV